jgi:hypothetical protein
MKMEILGSRIPNLQNAIASGLESVAAGIAESTKASGVVALGIAQDSFSTEQIGTTNTTNLPAVSETAEYPAPNQYFGRFPGSTSDSPVSSLAISKTLSDPNFDVTKSLQTFSQASQKDKYDIGDLLGAELDAKFELPTDVTYGAVDRLGQDKSDAASVTIDGGGHPADESGNVQDGIKAWEAMMWKPTPNEYGKRREDIEPGEAMMWKPTPNEIGRSALGSSDVASDRSIIVVGGKAAASDRSIIVVGGKDVASDRSIIVVGGKTSDTYLQTIDDSVNELKQNPSTETANLFRNQFGAVQNLLSTIDQVFQLQRTFASKLFEKSFRI